MGNSLMVGAALIGMDIRLGAPKACWPDEKLVKESREIADGTGAKLTLTEDPAAAAKGCDYVYPDVWVSMGEPDSVWTARIKLLEPYRVTAGITATTGNHHSQFMHCLPAFPNPATKIGQATKQKIVLN